MAESQKVEIVATFLVSRQLPEHKGATESVSFLVQATCGAQASRAAAEVAYAIAWQRGIYPDRDHRLAPEDWAVGVAASVPR